jgi:hypothetical protein
MNRFTDLKGFNGIRASPIWRFRAAQPPGRHPFGAYFTTLSARTPNLARRLGIPKSKVEYVFGFTDRGDLRPLPGRRGLFIFYSPSDYEVEPARQLFHGKRASP